MGLRACLLVLVVLVVLVASRGNAGASEDDRALSGSIHFTYMAIPEHSLSGGALGVEYERGLSDSVSFRAAGGGGLYWGDGAAYAAHAVVGLTYLVDVLKYVPYFTAGVGAIGQAGAAIPSEIHPALQLGAGLDILHSRTFSYGVQASYLTYSADAQFVTVGGRLTWRWDLF
jgi:hypothetical protein